MKITIDAPSRLAKPDPIPPECGDGTIDPCSCYRLFFPGRSIRDGEVAAQDMAFLYEATNLYQRSPECWLEVADLCANGQIRVFNDLGQEVRFQITETGQRRKDWIQRAPQG